MSNNIFLLLVVTKKWIKKNMSITNRIYKSYQREILYLQRHGNKLLQKIKQQEIKMNQRKQQNLQPNEKDLYTLNEKIKKLLRMVAFINSYRYFQLKNEPLSYGNEAFFYQMANGYYKDTLQRFVFRLKQLHLDRLIHFTIS